MGEMVAVRRVQEPSVGRDLLRNVHNKLDTHVHETWGLSAGLNYNEPDDTYNFTTFHPIFIQLFLFDEQFFNLVWKFGLKLQEDLPVNIYYFLQLFFVSYNTYEHDHNK